MQILGQIYHPALTSLSIHLFNNHQYPFSEETCKILRDINSVIQDHETKAKELAETCNRYRRKLKKAKAKKTRLKEYLQKTLETYAYDPCQESSEQRLNPAEEKTRVLQQALENLEKTARENWQALEQVQSRQIRKSFELSPDLCEDARLSREYAAINDALERKSQEYDNLAELYQYVCGQRNEAWAELGKDYPGKPAGHCNDDGNS